MAKKKQNQSLAQRNESYELSDKCIELLVGKAIKHLEALISKNTILGFDEINNLYAELESEADIAFLELAEMRYMECIPHGKRKPDRDWLTEFLILECDLTGYVYRDEITNKRDIAYENYKEAKTDIQRKHELERAIAYWTRQVKQYSDLISDAVTKKAFEDAGIKRVMWITMGDSKVCNECRPLNRKVFDVDKVPSKPHYFCRCTLRPMR